MALHQNASQLDIRFGSHSDTGRVRAENQDACGQFIHDHEKTRLFIVADGMGGHQGGREASTTALRVVAETYFRAAGLGTEQRLEQAFRAANERVSRRAQRGEEAKTMGTTCTALALDEGEAFVAHVGDSRAYRLPSDGAAPLQQITRDHTAVADLEREGVLTAEEAERHPRRHVLSRAIGAASDLDVDVSGVAALRPGDAFLLCSDGLASLSEEELATGLREAVRLQDPQQACEELVGKANERDGRDNATALIVTVACE